MERSRSTVRGNLIKENPIYEHLILTELPHISRHFLELKKSIGHGAFGGWLVVYFPNYLTSLLRDRLKHPLQKCLKDISIWMVPIQRWL